jgi:hypothetical protein
MVLANTTGKVFYVCSLLKSLLGVDRAGLQLRRCPGRHTTAEYRSCMWGGWGGEIWAHEGESVSRASG